MRSQSEEAPQFGAKARKVLVTGATSFLGPYVIRALQATEWSVIAATSHYDAPSIAGVSTIRFDVRDEASVRNAVASAQCDTIVHLAAAGVDARSRDPQHCHEVNVGGTRNLLSAAKASNVTTFLHAGSSAEYGAASGVIREDEKALANEPYGATKARATQLVIDATQDNQELRAFVLRLFPFYGPFEPKTRLVSTMIAHLREQRPLQLTHGFQRRDYMYVEDAADAFSKALNTANDLHGMIINIGSGHGHSLREIGDALSQILERDTAVLQWGKLPTRHGEVAESIANIERARRLIRWQPTTSLRDGLRSTSEVFASNGEKGEALKDRGTK